MELVLKPKPAGIFLFLKSTDSAYLSQIARETGTTYVYVTNFVSVLEQKQLVSVSRTGKKKMVSLTETGRVLAAAIEDVKRSSI